MIVNGIMIGFFRLRIASSRIFNPCNASRYFCPDLLSKPPGFECIIGFAMKALYLIFSIFRSFFTLLHFGDNLLFWNLSTDAIFPWFFIIRPGRFPWYRHQEAGPFSKWHSHFSWKDRFSCDIILWWVRRWSDRQIMFCLMTYRSCWLRCPWIRESSARVGRKNICSFFACFTNRTFCLSMLGKFPIMVWAYFENTIDLHCIKFSRNWPLTIHWLFSRKGSISIYTSLHKMAVKIFQVFSLQWLVPSILWALKNRTKSRLAKFMLRNGKIF